VVTADSQTAQMSIVSPDWALDREGDPGRKVNLQAALEYLQKQK